MDLGVVPVTPLLSSCPFAAALWDIRTGLLPSVSLLSRGLSLLSDAGLSTHGSIGISCSLSVGCLLSVEGPTLACRCMGGSGARFLVLGVRVSKGELAGMLGAGAWAGAGVVAEAGADAGAGSEAGEGAGAESGVGDRAGAEIEAVTEAEAGTRAVLSTSSSSSPCWSSIAMA